MHLKNVIYYICSILLALLFSLPVQAKDVNNFYFESFDADYYITKDAEGISHMQVVETLEAVFPDYDQNLGIVRYIPYTNQAGANITVPSKAALNVSITRNGETEPIYSIDREDGYYAVATGDDTTYLHGHQTFVFRYEFEKVITDFEDHQELYWDTNGTGWSQKFNSLTARVHFLDTSAALSGETACYVGSYQSSDQTRCSVTPLDDGYEFHAENLARRENLTFAIGLVAGTFYVPITYDYSGLVVFGISVFIAAIILAFALKKYFSVQQKRQFYKGLFLTPQYQPAKNLTVAETADIAMFSVRDSRVASLIDLAVHKKITLVRGEKRAFAGYDWKVQVHDLTDVPEEQVIMLKIINGGPTPAAGSEILMKKHSYSAVLNSLGQSYNTRVRSSLYHKGYLTKKDLPNPTNIFAMLIVIFIMVFFALPAVIEAVPTGGVMVGGIAFFGLAFIILVAAIIASSCIKNNSAKYAARSEKGLEAARYAEGLKLYMQMAESERLNFLQSVEGADTSPAGIVKLYEKLLPYAIIFGLEESWLGELNRYYAMADTPDSSWYLGAAIINTSDFHHFVSSSSAHISSSITASSSGSGLSGGGGGGGFSGGGGGGGGGGGR